MTEAVSDNRRFSRRDLLRAGAFFAAAALLPDLGEPQTPADTILARNVEGGFWVDGGRRSFITRSNGTAELIFQQYDYTNRVWQSTSEPVDPSM